MVDECKNNFQDNESAFNILISNKTALLCVFKTVLYQFYSNKWKDKHDHHAFAEVAHT